MPTHEICVEILDKVKKNNDSFVDISKQYEKEIKIDF